MFESVGKTLISTCLSASVMQYSAVRGGNRDEDKVDSRRGILLMTNDLRTVVDCARSFRDCAFARISKAASIISTMVDRISP